MIRIWKRGRDTYFDVDGLLCQNSAPVCCRSCGRVLNIAYVYLMWKLKKEELIDKNQRLLCCLCKSVEDECDKILKETITGLLHEEK